VGLLDFLKKKKEDAPAGGGGVTIKVGPRDTLKSLAIKYYGDEKHWTDIYDKNKWRIDGDEVVVGQDVLLPTIPGKGPKENV
jgi:nucleoid-associated protein YgaU